MPWCTVLSIFMLHPTWVLSIFHPEKQWAGSREKRISAPRPSDQKNIAHISSTCPWPNHRATLHNTSIRAAKPSLLMSWCGTTSIGSPVARRASWGCSGIVHTSDMGAPQGKYYNYKIFSQLRLCKSCVLKFFVRDGRIELPSGDWKSSVLPLN